MNLEYFALHEDEELEYASEGTLFSIIIETSLNHYFWPQKIILPFCPEDVELSIKVKLRQRGSYEFRSFTWRRS